VSRHPEPSLRKIAKSPCIRAFPHGCVLAKKVWPLIKLTLPSSLWPGPTCSHSDERRTLNWIPSAEDPAYRAAKQAADWRGEMLDKNSRTVVGRLIWQMGVTAALALSLLAVLALGKRVYMLEEALTVMLLIAISVAVILILLVVFVLFQAGIRQVFLWLRAGIVRLARLTNGQVPPPDSIIPPSMPR
jgi:hypothetical protein